MERKLSAVVLASIVLVSTLSIGTAGVLSAGAGNHPAAGNQAATLSVTSTGSATAAPDEATVHVTVSVEGDNASVAVDRLSENVSMLRDALDDENLSVTSVRTTEYSVEAERPGGPPDDDDDGEDGNDAGQGDGPPSETTYVGTQTLAVTTNDTEAVGDVTATALSNGATEVGDVSFSLSDETRQDLRSEAVDEAVGDAKVQARSVADSTNLTLDHVSSVTVGDDTTVTDTNPVTVRATVTVTYNATAQG